MTVMKTDRRLVYSLAAYLAATYVMSLVNCYADWRADALGEVRGHTPLPDIGFDLVPENRELLWTLDILTNLEAVLLIACALRSRHRVAIACRFMNLHAAMLALRSLTVASTSMPAPVPCTNLIDATQTHVLLAPLRHLGRADAFMSWCHDLMFSGHQTFMVLATWFVAECRPHMAVTAFATLLVPLGVLALLSTRSHYTSDIVVATVLATLLYQFEKLWRHNARLHAAKAKVARFEESAV